MDEDFYIEETSPIKVIIIVVIFFGLIAGGMYYYLNFSKNTIVKLKKVTVELGEALPQDISYYIDAVNAESYKLDLSSISVDENGNVDSTGEYSYRIKKDGEIKKGKLFVKDTLAPNVTTEDLSVGVNEEFEPSEFVTKCEDLSLPCTVKYKNSKDEKLNSKEGTYNVDIVITDDEDNSVTKKVKLTVGKETLAGKKSANLNFDHLSQEDINWDRSYTLKLDKAVDEFSETYEDLFNSLSIKEYEFSKTLKDKTILVAYNEYDYVIGFSIRVTFDDDSYIYVTKDNAIEKQSETAEE